MNPLVLFWFVLRCFIVAMALAMVAPAQAAAPQFTYVPDSFAVIEGQSAYLYADGTGSAPLVFQWFKDGSTLLGATEWNLTIPVMAQANVGSYTLRVTNSEGSVTSTPIVLSMLPPIPPTIPYWGQPAGASIFEGQSFSLGAFPDGSSPFTVTWKKDGVVVLTEDVSYNSYYSVAVATLSDAGSYVATFENGGGSASTNAVRVDVAPAIAPAIAQQPADVALYRTGYTNLYFNYSGTSPATVQWFHDGSPITGATSQWLTINNATDADAGTYKATVTNIKGTATTNEVTVTVNIPPPPTIINQSPDRAMVQGSQLYLHVYAQSEGVTTYQWYRDGSAIELQRSDSLTIADFKDSDAGVYRCAVTNPGGITYGRDMVVTYIVAELPVFVSQPGDRFCLPGESVWLSAETTCNATVTYSWFKDGVVVPNANWSGLTVSTAESSSSHVYVVRATSLAGSVDSAPVTVVVGPPQPARLTEPLVVGVYSSQYYTSLSASAVGTLPLTFQWFRNGTAIPEATSSYLSYYTMGATDFADYHVVVSNSYGSDTSNRVTFRPDPMSSTYPSLFWVDAVQHAGVYYFLMTNPGRIERYDIASESWLTSWGVEGVPSALAVADDAVYVAVERTISKYPVGWGMGVPLINATANVRSMIVADNMIFASIGDTWSRTDMTVDRRSGELIATSGYWGGTTNGKRLIYDPQSRRVVGAAYSWIVDTDGRMSEGRDVSTGSAAAQGGMAWLAAESRAVDGAGYIFDTADTSCVGSFGMQVDDVTTGDDGYLVLRGTTVISTNSRYGEVASLTLPGRGERIIRKGDSVIVFGQPSGVVLRPSVWKRSLTEMERPEVAAPLDPNGLVFTPQEIRSDDNGVIYLLNRLERNILRWSPASRSYLPSIPLPAKANHFTVAADGSALYFDNGFAEIRKIDLNDNKPEGTPMFVARNTVRSMQVAGDFLLVASPYYGPLVAVNAQGEVVGTESSVTGSLAEIYWRASSRRVVVRADYVSCTTLGVDGVFGPSSTYSYDYVTMARVSPGGDVLISDQGYAFSLPAMARIGTLPSAVKDVAWSENAVHTVRAVNASTAELASLSPSTYLLQHRRTVQGEPLGLFGYGGDSLVMISKRQGQLVFEMFNTRDLGKYPCGFDAEAYLRLNPDVAAAVGIGSDRLDRAWEHFYLYGIYEGRTPDGAFTAAGYLAAWPDLEAVFGTDVRGAALHWLNHGRYEGRGVPAGFDAIGYLARNPDVQAAYGLDLYGAWRHYHDFGVEEGRVFDDWYRTDEYLAMYTDVPSGRREAMLHWLNTGRNESRQGRVPPTFDVNGYLARYADLQAAFGGNRGKAWGHYLDYGAGEGRTDGDFDAIDYLARNGDVYAAFGNDVEAAALHWYLYGRYEGRRIPGGFDAAGYLARYGDLQAAFTYGEGHGADLYGAWLHFYDWGIDEGRVYDEHFRADEYLARYGDLQAAFGTDRRAALLHWLRFGRGEGRLGRF